MRRLVAAALIAATVTFVMPTGYANAAESLHVESASTEKYPEVHVVVTPPPSLAQAPLGRDAFALSENGDRQAIEVTRLGSDDVEIVLALDTSGSMRPVGTKAREAARLFLDAMPPSAHTALVVFNSTARVAVPIAASRSDVQAGIDAVAFQGETSLYDALVLAGQQFDTAHKARRFVVLLSDGGDTTSAATVAQATDAMKARGATLFAVSLTTPESDANALRSIADQVAGRVIPVQDAAALQDAYAQVASQITSQYELVYHSQQHGNAEVAISVTSGKASATATLTVALPSVAAAAASQGAVAPTATSLPVTTTVEKHGWTANRWTLPAGAAAIFCGLFVLVLILSAPTRKKRNLAREFGVSRLETSRSTLSGLTHRATAAAERTLEKHERRQSLALALERAGMPIRPGEFVVILLAVAFATSLLTATLTGGNLIAVAVVLVASAVGVRWYVSHKAERRRDQFTSQLGSTLQLMSSHLRTGYGLSQAFDVVARESESPTAEEFGRVVSEHRLGRDSSDALHSMSRRMGSDDFEWVVEAIDIHREVGGDLAEVLDNVAKTIRDRDHMRRQVQSLSADGRISATVLMALPIVMLVWLRLTNPDYVSVLFTRTSGRIALTGAGTLMLIGFVWLRRIIRIKF